MKLQDKDKRIISIIVFVSLSLTIFFIIKIYNILKYPLGHPDNILYSIKTNNNIDYRVYLQDNSFIEEEYLDENYSYITSLIDSIDINFNYEASLDDLDDIDVVYYIESELNFNSIDDTINKSLYNNNYLLSNYETMKVNNNIINLSVPIDVDINDYNNMVERFTQNLNVFIDAMLDIKLNIEIKNEDIYKVHTLGISMPLGSNVFEISKFYDFDEEEIVYNNDVLNDTGYVNAIIYIIVGLLNLLITFLLIRYIINKKYSLYSKEKNQILKNYDDRIVSVRNFIKLDKWEIVNVEDFNELLDLANEAYEPIFFFEKRINNKKEAWFSILKDKVVYKYVIKKNINRE